MFHFWHTNMILPQENLTEPALYAVAFTGKSAGIYPASPLSASECVEAKQGRGAAVIAVRSLTGTVAQENLVGGLLGQNIVLSRQDQKPTGKFQGNPMCENAGGTRSVAYLPKSDMSLRGNDGNSGASRSQERNKSFRSHQTETRAMDASAYRCALSSAAMSTPSFSNGRAMLLG